MKNLWILSVLIFTTASTLAQADVQSDMKQIGALFKTLSTNVNNASQNAQSAAAATQLVTLFTDVQNQVPDSITSMPADQQAAAIADYKSLIQQEIDDANALAKAFTNNDNAGAATLINAMAATKQDGHDKYNPN